MENKNIISTIRENYDDMSKSFKKVADYILNNTKEVSLYKNMSTLAEKIEVSKATVIRFAKHLNLEGSKELQKKLREIEQASLTTKQDILNIIEEVADNNNYSEERNRFAKYLLENHENIEDLETIIKKLNISRGVIYNFTRRYFNISSFKKFKNIMSGKEKPLNLTENDTLKELGLEFKEPKKSNWNLNEMFSIMKKANNILIYDPFEEVEFLLSDQLKDIGFLNQYEKDYQEINSQLDYFIDQKEKVKNSITDILADYFKIGSTLSKGFLKQALDYQDLLIIYVNHDKRNEKDFEEIDKLIQKAKANRFKVILFEGGNKLFDISLTEIDRKIVIKDLVPKMSYHHKSPIELHGLYNAFYFIVMIKGFGQAIEKVS